MKHVVRRFGTFVAESFQNYATKTFVLFVADIHTELWSGDLAFFHLSPTLKKDLWPAKFDVCGDFHILLFQDIRLPPIIPYSDFVTSMSKY